MDRTVTVTIWDKSGIVGTAVLNCDEFDQDLREKMSLERADMVVKGN